MQKLLDFIGLLFSVCRLLWRLLCFAWHRGFQLRLMTDQLRLAVTDIPLAGHGVRLGTEALKVVNANSIEVQRFTDYGRAFLETDLVAQSLPVVTRALAAATSEAPRLHALRNELSQLIDTALPGHALDAAAKAVHTVWAHQAAVNALAGDPAFVDAALSATAAALDVAHVKKDQVKALLVAADNAILKEDLTEQALVLGTSGLNEAAAQSTAVKDLLAAANHLVVQQPLTSSALPVVTKAFQVASTNMLNLVALNTEALAVLNTALPGAALTLTAKSLQVAGANEARLRQTAGRLESILNTPPVEETFRLAETGASLYWNNSAGLLNLLLTSRDALIGAGTASVMASYFLNGEASRSGSTPPTELQTPDAFKTMNVVEAVRDAVVGLTEVHNILVDTATNLSAVEVPTGRLVGQGDDFTVTVGSLSATLYTEGWTVEIDSQSPLDELAKKFHDTDSSNQNTATKKVNKAIGHLTALQERTEAESTDLYLNGLTLFEIGRAL